MTATERAVYHAITGNARGRKMVELYRLRELLALKPADIDSAVRALLATRAIYYVGDHRLVSARHIRRAPRATCLLCDGTGDDPRYLTSRCSWCAGSGELGTS